ncbi:hypothetical protein BST81_06690 [Leptolyngbya sp. 'hensonii']|uniref:hypothetical protein n=1 Tax=Leptolyngbya sp. 'hensonii' TaxID=1922337 RepID=UPI00094FAF61|nr:hypothetical protein [Leptolyngbya sp. 'hensonii']OLP19180.1 hypothetical protein BST81_06690 [Leptolyngbya sp. 'hensonii']
MTEPISCEESITRIDVLVESILASSATSTTPLMAEQIQDELAKVATTLQRVRRCLVAAQQKQNKIQASQLESIASGLETAIMSFQLDSSKILLVRRMRRDAEFFVRELTNPVFYWFINSFKYVIYESTTPVKVLFGLILALPIYLLVPQLPYRQLVEKILDPVIQETPACKQEWSVTQVSGLSQDTIRSPQQTRITECDVDQTIASLVMVGIAGSLGSIVSILTRIKDYENEKYSDTVLPIWIGALKPLIGGTFGILIFTLASADLLPLRIDSIEKGRVIQKWYALYAIAFIVGFSERLVKDIISKTEDQILPAQSESGPKR